MERLQEKLGYRFRDRTLLTTALTHPSFGSDHHVAHYQRLEFLGDAVLELVVSQYLYQSLPDMPEGTLTRMRAHAVREEALFQAARRLELGRLVRLSVGEERTGGREKPSILADVAEAVFAAVYLDGGLEAARRVGGGVGGGRPPAPAAGDPRLSGGVAGHALPVRLPG